MRTKIALLVCLAFAPLSASATCEMHIEGGEFRIDPAHNTRIYNAESSGTLDVCGIADGAPVGYYQVGQPIWRIGYTGFALREIGRGNKATIPGNLDIGPTGRGTVNFTVRAEYCPIVPNPNQSCTAGNIDGSFDFEKKPRAACPKGMCADKVTTTGNYAQNGNNTNTCNPTKKSCGEPVVVASGSMWHENTDFFLPGRTPTTALNFSRVYVANSAGSAGGFGPNWHFSFETKLLRIPNDGGPISYVWIDEMGGPWTFQNANTPPIGLDAKLQVFSDHYELIKKDKTKLYFSRTNEGIPSGRLYKIQDLHGDAIDLSYNAEGNLETLENGFWGIVRLNWNSTGTRITGVTRERDNLSYTYSYNSDGRLESVTDFANLKYQYAYETGSPDTFAQGLLRSIKDPLNRELRFTYYADGRAHQQFEPGGGVRTFFYEDHKTTLTEIDGTTQTFLFDENLFTKMHELPDGTRIFRKWQNGRVVEEFTEFGGKTKYTYDSKGNLTGVQKPMDSGFTQITYDLNFNKPTSITPLVGAPTEFSLSSETGDVLQMSRAGLSLDFTRDDYGTVLSTSNGKTTYTNETDNDGLLTHVFDSHNPETRTYDARLRLATRQFLSGRTLTYGYDDYDRIISIADSHGPSISNSYDPLGKLLSRTVSDGSTNQITSYTYDDRDRLVTVTDPMNRTTTFAYDPVKISDKPIAITDAANRTTYFEYDLRHRLVKKTDAVGAITKFTYDQRDNLTSVTDALGQVTRYFYDLNDRKIREVRPSVAGTTAVERVQLYFYDQGGRLVREVIKSATGGRDRVISYEYDELDRLVGKRVGREGNSLLDQAFKLVTGKSRDFSQEEYSTFTYEDQLDAILLKTAVNDIANLGFTNEAAPPFANSGFSMAASQDGNPVGLIEGNFEIGRDVTGEISSVAKDGENLITKSYDSAGRLTGATAGSFSSTIGYDGFGRKNSVSHSSGESGSFQHDLLSRLTQVTWTGPTPISETLAYDPITGNPTSITRESGAYSVAYDAIDQLTSSTGAYDHSLTYDALGNREQSSVNGAGTFVNNFLVSNGQSTFRADPNGFGETVRETTGSIVKNYLYRVDGRMGEYESGSTLASYYYDALGRRVGKAINTGSEQFNQSFVHLGLADRILMAKAGDGSITTYIDGQGVNDHLAEVKNGVGKGYITDHLGSVLNGDTAGASNSFGLFGEISASVTASPTSPPIMYGWQGLSYDAESGSFDNLARRYNQNTGTFASQDPLGFGSGEVNYLGSRRNNPLIYSDSSGLKLDLAGYTFTNPNVLNALTKLNASIVTMGYKNEEFTIRVTGGDRYLDKNGAVRSLTDDSLIPTATKRSPHLLEKGARAVDFNLEGTTLGSGDVRHAMISAGFQPDDIGTPANYSDGPHYHGSLWNDRSNYGPFSNYNEYNGDNQCP